MNIHEYQAKQLFERFNAATPKGRPADTPEEAEKIAASLNTSDLVVKAQIHTGGRGKGTFTNGFKGGVKLCKTPAEAREIAEKMLGQTLVTHQTGPAGRLVRKVLVAQSVEIEQDRLVRRRVAKLMEANEALRGCLDAIALVPEVDDFLGQVMAATTRQLNASSSALFLRDDESNFLILDLVFQDGRVLTPAEASFPEKLRSVRLGKREIDLAQQPAVLVNLVNGPTLISHSHRSYLLGLGVKTLLIIPLIVGRRLVGSLNFRFTDDRAFRPEEIEIARALAAQTSLAVQLTRLAKTARHSAVLEERNRLAGEIHDSLAQSFAAIATQLDLAGEVIEAREDDFVRYLDRAKDLARFGLAEARRTALSLEPFILDKIGLTETIEMLVERSNVPGRLQCSLSANDVRANDLPLETQHNLLRIAQEAISNAVRHANPTTILVSLRTFDSSSGRETFDPSSGPGCARCYLELQIQDNGRGISAPELMSQNGFGLINMQNRAKKIGASLDIRTNPGRGTAIVVRLPINA